MNLGRADVIVFICFYRRVQNMKFITMMACLKIDLPPGVRAMDWTWNCQVLWPQHGVHDLRHDEYHYGVSVNFYRFHDAWESLHRWFSQQRPQTRPCLWMRLCLAWNTTMCLGEFGDSDKYTKGADFRLGEKENIYKCQQLNIIHTSLIFCDIKSSVIMSY